jgi:hypothetical protein
MKQHQEWKTCPNLGGHENRKTENDPDTRRLPHLRRLVMSMLCDWGLTPALLFEICSLGRFAEPQPFSLGRSSTHAHHMATGCISAPRTTP